MKVKNIRLTSGLLIVKAIEEEVESKSGIFLGKSDGDFIIRGEIVSTASEDYPLESEVVYHILDCEAFRDGEVEYHLLSVDKIKGVYAQEK